MGKKIILFAAAALLAAQALSSCSEKEEATLKVATYNIRNENRWDYDEGNGWDGRCPYICDMLRYEAPDVFGCQEVLVGQLKDLSASLPEYEWVGVGRDDGAEAGEFEPNGTFNDFDPSAFSGSRIDHIFVSPSVRVDDYAVRTDTFDGNKCLSDHYPVFVKASFPTPSRQD